MRTSAQRPEFCRCAAVLVAGYLLTNVSALADPVQVVSATGPTGTTLPEAAQFELICTHGVTLTEVSSSNADCKWYVKDVGTGGDFVESGAGTTYSGSDLPDSTYIVKAEFALHDIPGDPDNGTAAHVATHEWDVEILAAAGARPVNLDQTFQQALWEWPGRLNNADYTQWHGSVMAMSWKSSTNNPIHLMPYKIRESIPSYTTPQPPFSQDYAGRVYPVYPGPEEEVIWAFREGVDDRHGLSYSICAPIDEALVDGQFTVTQSLQYNPTSGGWSTFGTAQITREIYSYIHWCEPEPIKMWRFCTHVSTTGGSGHYHHEEYLAAH